MTDRRPDLPDWGQGLLAAVGLTAGATYEVGFYWWTLPVTLGFRTGVVFVARRTREQGG
jgi:hypothetical protein